MVDAPHEEVTVLLQRWSDGDRAALDELVPRVGRELRRLAASYLRRERAGHTLQPTALVNEAYLRLLGQERISWQNRSHFFGIAAQVMRRLLVDHAAGGNRENGSLATPCGHLTSKLKLLTCALPPSSLSMTHFAASSDSTLGRPGSWNSGTSLDSGLRKWRLPWA